jgi:hypothetical protein
VKTSVLGLFFVKTGSINSGTDVAIYAIYELRMPDWISGYGKELRDVWLLAKV